MGIRFLSRTEYCSLAGLEVEQFNVLRRRDQAPSVPNLDLTEEVANERGYEASGAFLLIVANELVERYEMSRECAARVAACGRIMFSRWEEVAATSAEIAAGNEPAREILFAVIDWRGVARDKATNRPAQKVAVGNLKEVADQHSMTAHNHGCQLNSMRRVDATTRNEGAHRSGRVLEQQKASVVKTLNVARAFFIFTTRCNTGAQGRPRCR